MSATCRGCLRPAPGAWHDACAKALFGSTRVPRIDVELAKLHELAFAMAGHVSLSGVQRKLSLEPSADRQTLRVALEGGTYILKPQTGTFPNVPENEHAPLVLARLAGIEVPPFGLVTLTDGSEAYLVRRFDRAPGDVRLRLEDFCQLADLPPRAKYEGSGEQMAALVRRFATDTTVEIARLFRQLLFAWWTGNGDLHRKNLSLLKRASEGWSLSPAYDLLSTRLVLPTDQLALPIGGRRDGLARPAWLRFGEHIGLPERAVRRALGDLVAITDEARATIHRSFLPGPMRDAYAALIERHTDALAEGGRSRA
jgi:serine/threonine-protein kinase HipA